MASPGQRRGVCGHAMAGFDQHAHCARCRDKKKGSDPCVKGNICPSCNILTEEQKLRLATPVYQNKKEKKESKMASEDCTLVDPALVSVLGVSTDSGIKSSEEASNNTVVVKAKKNIQSSEEASSVSSNAKVKKIKSPAVSQVKPEKSKKRQSSPKPSDVSTDSKLEAMDSKWVDRFNRLEAVLLSKSLSQPEPTFQPVKLSPVRPPPTGIAENINPFFVPTTKVSASHEQGDKSLSTDHPSDMPVLKPVAGSSGLLTSQPHSEPEMDTDSASDSASLPDLSEKGEKGELSDLDPDNSLSDVDQAQSDEQTYRETMRGIRAYMNWNNIPDMDTTQASAEDNPFAAPKIQPAGKISVQLPTDDWLCRKMDRLNLTLTQGYPAKGSEPGGLQRDQFIKPTKSQGKWYGLHPSPDKPAGSVSFWHSDNAKVNSTFSRIARYSALSSPAPASCFIAQDTLRKWEKSAREATYMCNQAAGLSRCLNKVQQDISSQLKIIQGEHTKGKSASKASSATNELQHLMHFNSSIFQCMAKTVEHLSDFAFVSMCNFTLARRDSYLALVKAGIKQDTLASLRQAPMQLDTLFPDLVLRKAEEDISKFEDRGRSQASSTGRKDSRFHPYKRPEKSYQENKQARPAWKNIGRFNKKKAKFQGQKYSSRQARGYNSYK